MKNLKYILSPYSTNIYNRKYNTSADTADIIEALFANLIIKTENIENINWDIECQIRNEIAQKENRNTFF
jgi:hypothetical protein